jgi:hypothetical protein
LSIPLSIPFSIPQKLLFENISLKKFFKIRFFDPLLNLNLKNIL